MEDSYLVIKNLSKVYNPGTAGEVVALNNVSLSLAKGEFATIIGNNAAGKTTLFNLIGGDLGPTAGTAYLSGKAITKLPEHQKSKFISRVRQNPNDNIAVSMTLAENLAMAQLKSLPVGLRRGVKKEWKQKFTQLLEPFGLGLEKRLDDKIDLLSGGQKQTVALLMATMSQPDLLLLDEHTAALDPKMSNIILNITDKIVKENQTTTLMITHNISHALQHGNTIILMQAGGIQFTAREAEKQSLTVADLVNRLEKSGVEI